MTRLPISEAPQDKPLLLWIGSKPVQEPITLSEVGFDIGATHFNHWPEDLI